MKFDYELIDSGAGARLERFGTKLLVRPSKFSVWQRRRPTIEWQNAHATYEHKRGWSFSQQSFEQWDLAGEGASLRLRLQDNGQIGFFPEHAAYLPSLLDVLTKYSKNLGRAPRVLNLFAYTGMATVAALRAGADVTHVDLSKKVLDWARENAEANKLNSPRFIREDALTFLDKEVRRGNTYEVVIADPPSFSRVSPKEEWTLEDVLPNLISQIAKVASPQAHAVFLTSHHFESGGHVMANLLHDAYCASGSQCRPCLETEELAIAESGTGRVLPAGFLVKSQVSI